MPAGNVVAALVDRLIRWGADLEVLLRVNRHGPGCAVESGHVAGRAFRVVDDVGLVIKTNDVLVEAHFGHLRKAVVHHNTKLAVGFVQCLLEPCSIAQNHVTAITHSREAVGAGVVQGSDEVAENHIPVRIRALTAPERVGGQRTVQAQVVTAPIGIA